MRLIARRIAAGVRWRTDWNGLRFASYRFMGYEYLLMLAFVALQVIVEAGFLLGVWLGRHHDFEHRIANALVGLGCSMGILIFDLALKYGL